MQVRKCKLNLFLDDAPRVDLAEWKYMLSKCLSDFMNFVMFNSTCQSSWRHSMRNCLSGVPWGHCRLQDTYCTVCFVTFSVCQLLYQPPNYFVFSHHVQSSAVKQLSPKNSIVLSSEALPPSVTGTAICNKVRGRMLEWKITCYFILTLLQNNF